MLTNRQSPLSKGDLVSYRGLWDRFCQPNSGAAFFRSLLKGVPCIVNVQALDDGCRGIVVEAVEKCPGVPVFIMDPSQMFADELARGGAVFWIDTSTVDEGFYTVSLRGADQWELCGYYLPVANAAGLSAIPPERLATSLNLVLFESTDVLTSVEEMGLHGIDDANMERQLARLFPGLAAVKVSDLAEGTLLRRQLA